MRSFATACTLFVALVGLSSAQTFDVTEVPLGTRSQWCVSQRSSCPLICLQYTPNNAGTRSNTCDSATLTYTCVCSNGIQPNASEYSQTVPYFICQEDNQRCIAACGNGNNVCQSNCNVDNPCGARNPTLYNSSTITSMPSTTSRSGGATQTNGEVVYTGLGGDAAEETAASGSGSADSSQSSSSSSLNNNNANSGVTLNLARGYGLATVVAGLFGGFALML